MKIYVLSITKGKIKLHISEYDTIRTIELLIEQKWGLEPTGYYLEVNNIIIRNSPNIKLKDLNIEDGSKIKLKSRYKSYQLFIKWLTGITFTVCVTKNDTIRDLTLLINHKMECHDYRYRLIYGGKLLEQSNDRTMDDYDIGKEDTIFVGRSLRGD
jgi:hypothetical protein